MLRSLMTGVTGIKAHQTMLDVVGNNVANVNTSGFKRSTTVFQDLLYQSSRGATAPGDNRGGVNPMQVGLGVQVAGIEMVYTDGPMQYTGSNTDMAIGGNGFFVFSDGTSNVFSRAGNFSQDADGTLVHVGTGYRVQGYPMETDPADPTKYIKGASLSDIKLQIGAKMEANPTSVVGFKCNLDGRVGTYLPMGAPNLDAKINLETAPYTVQTSTDYTDATQYLTYTFNTDPAGAGAPGTVTFAMTDIKDGKPVFGGAGNPALTLGSLPAGTTVSYNDNTGVMQLKNAAGATIFETNTKSSMKYTSFTMKNGADTYTVMGEFDPATLNSSPADLNMWIMKPGEANPSPMKVQIPLKIDGTFDIPEAGIPVTLPAGYTGTLTIPSQVTSQGRGFQFQYTPAAVGSAPQTVGLTQQDMTAIHTTKIDIYDCQGNAHTLEVQLKKIAENEWRWEAFFPKEPDLFPVPPSGIMKFSTCGKLESPSFVELDIPFSLVGANNQKVKLDFSGESFGLGLMDGVTQYGSPTTTTPYYQDGYAMGTMTKFSTGKDGTISGVYSNGKTIPLYRIAMATFQNPGGLERIGDTVFRDSANSGLPQIGVPMEGGAGSVMGSNLEMSNVDLSEEFTRLILAQRGFQANARVVTTSDSVLEEVVNLKR